VTVETLAQQLVWLLLGAALVGMLARWIQVPYAVALVVGGLLVEASHVVALPTLDPSLVLFIFLPPLLFDAAFRLDAREFRAGLAAILVFAVPGVLVTALAVALVLVVLARLPLPVSLLFGAIVAATVLVGFSVSLASLGAQLGPVLAGILAVLVARLVVILSPALLPRAKQAFTGAERLVLVWAGLRGALTITLALALPVGTPARDLLITMAFGVVLFTLLAQGLTLPLVLRRVGLNPER
jgi:NhaP-type Na+/H+ or K+/H+ antiporter